MGLKQLPKSKQALFWSLVVLGGMLAFSYASGGTEQNPAALVMMEAALLGPAYLIWAKGEAPKAPEQAPVATPLPQPIVSVEAPPRRVVLRGGPTKKLAGSCGRCGNWGWCYNSAEERDRVENRTFTCPAFQEDPTKAAGIQVDLGKDADQRKKK